MKSTSDKIKTIHPAAGDVMGEILDEVDRMVLRLRTHGRHVSATEVRVYHHSERLALNILDAYFRKPVKIRKSAISHEQAGGDCYVVEVTMQHGKGAPLPHERKTGKSYLVLGLHPIVTRLEVLFESHYGDLHRAGKNTPVVELAKDMRSEAREALRTYGPIVLGSKPKVRSSWLWSATKALPLIPGALDAIGPRSRASRDAHVFLSTPTMYDEDNVPIAVAAATVIWANRDTRTYDSYLTLLTHMEYEKLVKTLLGTYKQEEELPQAGRPAIQIEVTLAFPCEPTANQVRDALHDIADKSRDCLYDQSGTFQPCESLVVPMLPGSLGAACIAVTRPEGREAPEAKRT